MLYILQQLISLGRVSEYEDYRESALPGHGSALYNSKHEI